MDGESICYICTGCCAGYLEEDLRNGSITLDEARELVAHFWVKGTEWIGIHGGSGDAQFYQNVILGGIDRDGREVTNELTYLILDVVEELHISDYPIAVRLGDKTPQKLFRRIAEVQRYGGGIVSVYNENVVIKALTDFGYPTSEAREYTNDGCWECIIPGKTAFIYWPNDMVPVLSSTLTSAPDGDAPEKDFETFYARFRSNLAADIKIRQDGLDGSWKTPWAPCALASLFTEGCVEKGRCYYNGGPLYTVNGIHYGGVSDVANSLLVIKKLVFEEKYLTLEELTDILRNNWEGNEGLRRLVQSRFTFYGNDDMEADGMMCRAAVKIPKGQEGDHSVPSSRQFQKRKTGSGGDPFPRAVFCRNRRIQKSPQTICWVLWMIMSCHSLQRVVKRADHPATRTGRFG